VLGAAGQAAAVGLRRGAVTEGAFLVDVTRASQIFKNPAGRGVRDALDDFGTGYSSLSRLVNLRPSALKIDRSFVSPGRPGTPSEAMLEMMIAIGSRLGMDVIAGIETPGAGPACRLVVLATWSQAEPIYRELRTSPWMPTPITETHAPHSSPEDPPKVRQLQALSHDRRKVFLPDSTDPRKKVSDRMTPAEAAVTVEIVGDAEVQAGVERALKSAGVSLNELAEQARASRFSSERARLVWFMVSPVVSQHR
jgi:hypothetical protein